MKRLLVLFCCALSFVRAQEALTLGEIVADKAVWPVEVMVVVDHKLPMIMNGKVVKTLKFGPGTMYKVKSIGLEGVTVFALGGPKTFSAEETDVIARAGQIRAKLLAPVEPPPETRVSPRPSPRKGGAHLPYTIALPQGFLGPIVSGKGSDTIYTYTRKNPPGNAPAVVQIGISNLAPGEEAMTVDALLLRGMDASAEHGVISESGTPAHSVLGNTPAREVSFKASSDLGKVAGITSGFVKYGKFYGVTIANAESLAPNSLPELKEALQSLRFGERPPPPSAAAPIVTDSALAPPAEGTPRGKIPESLGH